LIEIEEMRKVIATFGSEVESLIGKVFQEHTHGKHGMCQIQSAFIVKASQYLSSVIGDQGEINWKQATSAPTANPNRVSPSPSPTVSISPMLSTPVSCTFLAYRCASTSCYSG